MTSRPGPPSTDIAADADQLVRRIAAHRDADAFQTLFLAFAPRVKTYLIRHGASAEKAEELAQETLLSVWRKADYFDPGKAGAAGWIFTIARNLRIDAIRREQSALIYELAAPEPLEAPATPEAQTQTTEREGRIRKALALLSRDQIEVVRLSFFQDKPHAEIAKDLSLPLGTVKSRLRLALARLRGAVEDLA